MSQITRSTAVSTLATTQTTVPAPFDGSACTQLVITNPDTNAKHGAYTYATDSNLALLRTCCKGAPVVAYADGCLIYCEAVGQSLTNLTECIKPAVKGWGSWGVDVVNSTTTMTPTTTGTTTSTRTATPTTTSSKPSSAANARQIGGNSVSYAVWGTIMMVAVGSFSGFMI